MKTTLLVTAAIFGLGLAQSASAAGVASLNDWCVNIGGDSSSLCNVGSAATFPTTTIGGVGVSGNLDLTLSGSDPAYPTTAAANTLGSASFVFGPGSSFVNLYLDYDLNYDAQGSFQDFGTVVNGGSLPAGFSYEIDDPNASNIFGDFSGNSLSNANNVGTYANTGDNAPCCDVSWALGVTVSVANGFQDTITFTSSSVAPVSGFYLQQTNGVDPSQNIYLSATVTEQQVGPTDGTPEPGTFLLLGAGLAGLIAWRARAHRQVTA